MSLIAILDDRVTNRNIFAKLAASIEPDVEVRSFGHPVEALTWMADNPPDLVVTDYKMPEFDGAEFTRRFRALRDCADVPVVVITIHEDRSFRLRALEAGATDFLQSPVDHHEFVTRARNLLKLRKQQLLLQSRTDVLEKELLHSERSRQDMLRDSRERLAQVIDTVPAMISAADRDGGCVFVNAFLTALAGTEQIGLVGRNVAMFGADHAERSFTLDRKVFESGKALASFEEEIVDATGLRRVFLTTKSPLRNGEGAVVNVLTTSLDITDRKRAEGHLLHMAHHDALTDLPNRTLMRDRIRREVVRARRGDRLFALHMLDLDRFKSVNDVLGHHVGDSLLKAVGERLLGAAGPSDTVARLGGDEFAILQADIDRAEDADAFARTVLDLLSTPFDIDGQEIATSASIGLTVHPTDASDVDDLFKNADLAMYRAKAEGRNVCRPYAADMNKAARESVVLESDLRRGLARKEFLLHYQPQVDLRSGRIFGAEALLRWLRPGRGMVRPGDFLPLAEENGLIVPINEWVLREACREAREWQLAGLPPLRIAVNISPVQFRKNDLAELVARILSESGLPADRLELELTESIVVQDAEAAVQTLKQLKSIGVCCSIDDFGTGYSSLSYLKNFPVDRLKIDQCFVRNLRTDPNDGAIVRAIINLGHSLKLQVVAEGVETAEQAAHLRDEGCDEVQGYYFGRPMPAEDFVALVRRETPLLRTA